MEVIGVNTLSISWETPSDMPDYPVPIAYNITINNYYEVLSDTVTLYSTVTTHVKVNKTRRVQFENLTPGELYHYCVTAIYNNSNEASKCGSETVTTLSQASGARLTEGILSLVIIILVVLLIVAGIGLAYPRCIRSRVKDKKYLSK